MLEKAKEDIAKFAQKHSDQEAEDVEVRLLFAFYNTTARASLLLNYLHRRLLSELDFFRLSCVLLGVCVIVNGLIYCHFVCSSDARGSCVT